MMRLNEPGADAVAR